MHTNDSQRTADRLLMLLKMRDGQTTQQLAERLGISVVAARQQLTRLEAQGDVEHEDRAGKIGRPTRFFTLTSRAQARFPDTHADLTVALIAGIRATLGEAALERLIEHQYDTTLTRYRQALDGRERVGDRVRILARLRDDEGYMAHAERQRDGSYLLVENHCPICAAAETCQGFCANELRLMAQAVGSGARVQRVDHLLDGARRCAYRIQPKRHAS